MRPGILIQHTIERSPSHEYVRSDIAGVLAVITKDKWPPGASFGDFIDLPLKSWLEFETSSLRFIVDAPAVHAVRHFFANGGAECHVLAVCIESRHSLIEENPLDGAFRFVLDHMRGEENMGLLAMPVLAYLPVSVDHLQRAQAGADAMVLALLQHCDEMTNRFLIVDPPQGLHGASLVGWAERNPQSGFSHRELRCAVLSMAQQRRCDLSA